MLIRNIETIQQSIALVALLYDCHSIFGARLVFSSPNSIVLDFFHASAIKIQLIMEKPLPLLVFLLTMVLLVTAVPGKQEIKSLVH